MASSRSVRTGYCWARRRLAQTALLIEYSPPPLSLPPVPPDSSLGPKDLSREIFGDLPTGSLMKSFSWQKPRPFSAFCHLRQWTWWGVDPPRISKLSVVELSGKKQRVALHQYSRVVLCFLILGQHPTQLCEVKSNFREPDNCSNVHAYI